MTPEGLAAVLVTSEAFLSAMARADAGAAGRLVAQALAAERGRCARLAEAGAAHESSRAAVCAAGRIAAAIREGREP
jgi:hypothetical protein